MSVVDYRTMRTCSFEGCEDKVNAAGLCSGHYMQKRSGKELHPKRKHGKYGAMNGVECAVVHCIRPATNDRVCQTHASVRRKRGLTTEALLEIYGRDECAACRSTEDLAIDHDHSCCPPEKAGCGECTRGLLCRRCNYALGYAQDDTERLRALADYLEAN